ncbi:MAG: FHA domain-containing protein [Chloroflexales bacterium]|nr:FHA domain-containing protein [Chloroflexales bacterium]
MAFDASEELLIGRKDNAKGIFPDIDMGLDGGYDAGVSRRHAIISFQNGVFVVEDLESANGTFINGDQLQPHVHTPLHHGDELKLGTLILRIELN